MIVLLCPWIYRDEVPSWEGELIATPGRPCLLLDSVPKLISFAYAAEKTSVSHTHTLTYTLPRNGTYPLSPFLRHHSLERDCDIEGLLEFDVSPPQ